MGIYLIHLTLSPAISQVGQATKKYKNGMKILIYHNTLFYFLYAQITEIVSFARSYIALFLFAVIGISLHAQTPQAINYQAVCRDTNGTPLAQQVVTYRASVLQGSPSGTVVYRETHTDTTNVYGISTLKIGRGTPVQGTFASIPWGSGSYYLSIDMDPAGGSNYRNLGAPELLSVPYALQSKDGIAKGTITNQLLFWNGTVWDTLNPGSSGQMLTMCNGNLIWGNCPGSITGLSCSSAVHTDTLIAGLVATNVQTEISYSGGNGGLYSAQTITSTGVTGLTAILNSGYFANGNDTLIFSISGTPSGSGIATFALNIGSQSCSFSRIVSSGSISTLACNTATHTGTLTSGIAASGTSISISYSGGDGGGFNSQNIPSTGITGLTASLVAGTFNLGNGTLLLNISGTPVGSGTASFNLTLGGQSCTLTRSISPATIISLNCTNLSVVGTMIENSNVTGVSFILNYSGGDGGLHPGQVVQSTGVSGITATLGTSNFAVGNGSLIYNLSGTPVSGGYANFNISIGGQTCVVSLLIIGWRPGMVHCNGPTQIVEVLNPATNRTWMDRNLGASQVATSSADVNAYGDLYQWGRFADGHQCRNSGTLSTLSTTFSPGINQFIIDLNNTSNWATSFDNSLWLTESSINNPCPYGYRLPSENELEAERTSWNSNNDSGAFGSTLRLTIPGNRHPHGSLFNVNSSGFYWTRTVSGLNVRYLLFNGGGAAINSTSRASGFSIRCIKD